MLQTMTKLMEWLSVALVGLALWLAAYTGSLQTAYRGELLWWVPGIVGLSSRLDDFGRVS